MKRSINGFWMSLSMFSILPTRNKWDETAFCWIIPCFPIVGAMIGGLWYGIFVLANWLQISQVLSAVLLVLTPLLLSGFIHMDGYMDTSDAIFSRAELSKKREILKDSHVGAFAVIALCVYLMLAFAGMYSALDNSLEPFTLVLIPVLSRCVTGIVLLNRKPISQTGFGATFRQNTKPYHSVILIFFATLCLLIGCLGGGLGTLITLVTALLGGILAAVYSTRQLDGISGDLCGFILTITELCALLALAVI